MANYGYGIMMCMYAEAGEVAYALGRGGLLCK